MKKLVFAFSCLLLLISCKEEGNLETLKGDFIYLDDAAVLHGTDFIYGVVIDENSKKLAAQVEPIKQDVFDMVPVEVKAIIKDNPDEEGWEKIIEIKEIIEVTDNRKTSKIKMN